MMMMVPMERLVNVQREMINLVNNRLQANLLNLKSMFLKTVKYLLSNSDQIKTMLYMLCYDVMNYIIYQFVNV